HDVAEAFAMFANEQTEEFAGTGDAAYPLVAAEGGKEPLRAELARYSMGSDHDVYQDSSFHIPAVYFNDWPDRYIHTNFDVAANIDPTKLKRAAFIGAASGYFLAYLKDRNDNRMAALVALSQASSTRRLLEDLFRARDLSDQDISDLVRVAFRYRHESVVSPFGFTGQGVSGNEAPPEQLFISLPA